MGKFYADDGDLAGAKYVYNLALEMDPTHVNAMHNLTGVHRRQKTIALYVKTYKQSQRLSLENPLEPE